MGGLVYHRCIAIWVTSLLTMDSERNWYAHAGQSRIAKFQGWNIQTGCFPEGECYADDRTYQCCTTTCRQDRKSTRLNSSHVSISYAVFCLKKKRKEQI